MPKTRENRPSLAFLKGGGQMGEAIRAFDWASTPLGPVETWPTPLKTAVGLLLGASQPVYVAYGPDLTSLYNDGYLPIVGTKHPAGLGAPFSVLWSEIWDVFKPIVEATMAGEAQHFVNLPIALGGRPDLPVGYFTFSYTALRDDEGNAVGFYCAATETTEQVLNEKKLAASDERLQLALSAGHGVGTWDWNIQADRVVADARFARLYGVDPVLAEAGAPLAEFFGHIHPDDAAGLQVAIDEAMRTGGMLSAEYRLVQPDGSAVWVLAEGRCQLGDDGAPLRLAGVTFDITARRAAEDELRRLNAELERRVIQRAQVRGMTWQVSPDLLGALNSQGYFETSNPAWKSVLGWSEEEVARTSIFELLHPDDLERTRAGFALTQIGQPAIRFPNRYRCKDGGYRWISWVGVPEDGMVYCSGRDITEEVAAASERENILALSRDLIGVATFDGSLRSINPAWSAALGRPEAELLARPFSEIIHPDDLAMTGEIVATLQSGQPVDQFLVRLIKADGESIPYAWSAVPDAAPESEIFYTIGRDISADMAKAEELSAAQDALRQAQKMEAVGQLTGGLAHDFNNLLAGISGSLELIRMRLAQGRIGELDKYVLAAEGAANRAAALTHRLLAFSRRQTLAPKPTDVVQLVSGMTELIARTVGPSIAVEAVNAAGLWATLIDSSQLENAILNLCINARDAMPGGGKITLETANRWLDARMAKERGLEPGQYISVCVSDTGTGMSPEVVSKAFDPFFTTKPLGLGTGLGLSMIYGFAKQSGGSVNIYSEIDQGTLVCVYLPRYLGDLQVADQVAELSAAPRGVEGETVLIVDDEPTVRMLVAEILADLGYTAIEAADGAAGLEVLSSAARIDLLVTDVGLPGGMNGRQMADAARNHRPDLKVLFITGYAENAVLSHGHLEAGMHVMTKPFAMEALASRIRSLIEA